MKSITVIGAGEAGIHLIKSIRSSGDNSSILLIDKRDLYFKKYEIFNSRVSKVTRDVTHLDEEFCSLYSVEYIKASVERINPATKKIFFKEHSSIEFDTLIITSGAVSKDLSIKGDFLEGLIYLSDIEPLKVRDYLEVSRDVVVYVSTILGIRAVLFLSSLDKDVKLITENLKFLDDYEQSFLDLLKDKKIDVYSNCRIEEAIGEVYIKAVRITLPKVLSSQTIFIDSGFKANIGFFDAGIEAKNDFYTNYDKIYILGDAANNSIDKDNLFIHNAEDARSQARVLASRITRTNLPDNNSSGAVFPAKEEFLSNILREERQRSV